MRISRGLKNFTAIVGVVVSFMAAITIVIQPALIVVGIMRKMEVRAECPYTPVIKVRIVVAGSLQPSSTAGIEQPVICDKTRGKLNGIIQPKTPATPLPRINVERKIGKQRRH